MEAKNKKALLEFDALCDRIKRTTPIPQDEAPKEKEKRIKKLLKDYNAFAKYYFPDFANEDCAPFHVEAAKKLLKNNRGSYIWRFFRGGAKSVHATVIAPLFLMAHDQLSFMVLVGANKDSAKRLLGDIQAQLMENQRIIHDFGEMYNYGDWEEGEFLTKKGHKFVALGMGQSPRGLRYGANRPDYIVCDDLDTAEMSRNKSRVEDATSWILEDLMGCFDKGNARFVLAGNLFSKISINFKLGENEAFEVIQVPAILPNGKCAWSKYTVEYFDDIKKRIGTRAFLREYMNEPIESGKVFQPDWIQWRALPPDFFQKAKLLAYCDPSYSAKGDYKAIKVWGKYDQYFYLIDCFVRKTTITEMTEFLYLVNKNYPNCEIWMEEQFIQDYFAQELKRLAKIKGYILPLRKDTRNKPNKLLRIESLTPLYENQYIFYNEAFRTKPDFEQAVEQLLLFGEGSSAHDDSPDADEGAIFILNRKTAIHERSKNKIKTIRDQKI